MTVGLLGLLISSLGGTLALASITYNSQVMQPNLQRLKAALTAGTINRRDVTEAESRSHAVLRLAMVSFIVTAIGVVLMYT